MNICPICAVSVYFDITGRRCSSHPQTPGSANEQVSNRNLTPRAEIGHRRKRVCFDIGRLSSTCGLNSPVMCSLIIPTTDIMSTVESQVGNSDPEDKLKGTKRKISLSK